MAYNAHSSDKLRGILNPQLYYDHVTGVYTMSREYLTDATKYSKMPKPQIDFLMDCVSLASYYHDIGKLDETSQVILGGDYGDETETKMLNHVDAGVSILLKKYEATKNVAYLVSAFLVHAHHLGLKNQNPMAIECLDKTNKQRASYFYKINERLFRDCRDILDTYNIPASEKSVKEYIDSHIEEYERIHRQEIGFDVIPTTNITRKIPVTSLQIRMLLSCLVDADHTDTDRFYSQKYDVFTFGQLQPEKRLELLKSHIGIISATIPTDVSPERLRSRQDLYQVCLTGAIPGDIDFFPLDGSVGLGKTFSGAVFGLRLATQRHADRFYNIIPYTNIISQTVGEYRKSILFPGEDENNINEIHSKCEFEKIWMRKYSNRWNAPVNVSTAVQFFESLVNNQPHRLRKLHWFANSVFFFDEFDKSIPHEYWQYVLPLLKEMASKFNCSFVFSSGTSAYYWDIFDDCEIATHDIIDKTTYSRFQNLEKRRVSIEILPIPVYNIDRFIESIWEKLGLVRSGVIVCNTINNTCVLAKKMRHNNSGYYVYELTGWQTPEHREKILDNIKESLRNQTRKTLVVATSAIECGVDISFDIGWREKCSPLNLFQFNGRVNRGSKSEDARVYVFSFDGSIAGIKKPFTINPQNRIGIQVFDEMIRRGGDTAINLSPDYSTEIVRKELEKRNNGNVAKEFLLMEENRQLQSISEGFNVIDSTTATIIIDLDLIEKIKGGEPVRYNEIVRKSIQLWFSKISQLQNLVNLNVVTSIDGKDYYVWEDEYDDATGIGNVMMSLR